jgi:hypothetical protein
MYKKIINLLLEEWDEQKSVKRYSRYAHFEIDRKFDFLCHLAFSLTTSLQKTIFSKYDLLRAYQAIYRDYDLVGSEAKQVVDELETHTGLFLQSGYEEFEFAHKSLQEYLTAEYIVKLPYVIAEKNSLAKLPNEFAIAVAISSNPSEYLTELVLNRLKGRQWSEAFIGAFVSRLLLEKPDLNTNAKTALVLLMLYTLYTRYCFFSQGTRSFFSDKTTIELEKIIKSMLQRESIEIIRKEYNIESVTDIRDGDTLCRLIKKEFKDRAIPGLKITPLKVLYVRRSWIPLE